MLATFLTFAVALAQAQAEIGLIIRSTNSEIDEKPVRLYDGQLAIDIGPILQGYFDTEEHLVISDHLISRNHTGAGLGLTQIQQLVIAQEPASNFFARGGWLEYGNSAVFFAEKDLDGWKLYTSPGDAEMIAVPAMLQVADIAYENHEPVLDASHHGSGSSSRAASQDTGSVHASGKKSSHGHHYLSDDELEYDHMDFEPLDEFDEMEMEMGEPVHDEQVANGDEGTEFTINDTTNQNVEIEEKAPFTAAVEHTISREHVPGISTHSSRLTASPNDWSAPSSTFSTSLSVSSSDYSSFSSASIHEATFTQTAANANVGPSSIQKSEPLEVQPTASLEVSIPRATPQLASQSQAAGVASIASPILAPVVTNAEAALEPSSVTAEIQSIHLSSSAVTMPTSRTRPAPVTRYATATSYHTVYAAIPTVTETIRVPIW